MVLIDLYRKFNHNRSLIYNIIGTFAVKGGTMLLSLISMPLYMNYFENNILLGVWFTMHTVLSWILVFDLGIGNGLRNHLTTALAQNDRDNARAYISSAYIMFGAFVAALSLLVLGLSHVVSWNSILNVPEHVIHPADLHRGVNITLVGIIFSFILRLINPVLYALQKSALPNFLAFVGSLLQVAFLYFYTAEKGDLGHNFIILAGFTLGWFTPTEASAVATIYALIISVLVYKSMDLKTFLQCLKESAISSANTLFIIGTSTLFTYVMAKEGISALIANTITGVSSNPAVVMFIINIILLILGMVMEPGAILTLMLPVLLPIADTMGYNLVYFGVVVVLNLMIGQVTPPFGVCLFVISDVNKIKLERIYKSILPFLVPLLITLAVTCIFPQVVTFLPDMLLGATAA